MKKTNLWQKTAASGVNVTVAIILSLPFYLSWGNSTRWKLSAILIFFIYELSFVFIKSKRDFGMIMTESRWEKVPSAARYFCYDLIYALSFSTLLLYIWFPFDLLLINLLLVQLPVIILTQNTFHGYLCGMATIKNPSSEGDKLDNDT